MLGYERTDYLEGQGDSLSRLITPISANNPYSNPIIPIINLAIKFP